MPRIFDNMEQHLVDALRETLQISERADFCVGYFNLRGWRYIDELMEGWQGGDTGCCRLLIGMQDKPEDELRKVLSLRGGQEVDQSTVLRLKNRVAQDFRKQLLLGAPSNADQEGLRRLSAQLRRAKWWSSSFCATSCTPSSICCTRSTRIIPIVGYHGQ